MKAEISYDLVMEDSMDFVEGSYRLPGQEWRVFIFLRKAVPSPEIQPNTWSSGITGISVRFPTGANLNQTVVERLLGEYLGVEDWSAVPGPDSMQLR